MVHPSDDSCIGFTSTSFDDAYAATLDALEAEYAARECDDEEAAAESVRYELLPVGGVGYLFPEVLDATDDELMDAVDGAGVGCDSALNAATDELLYRLAHRTGAA